MRKPLVVAVVFAFASVVAPACQLPVVSCDEVVERWAVRFPRATLVLLPSGAFRVDAPGLPRGGVFANCVDFCRRESNVKRVLACTPPVLIDETPSPYGYRGDPGTDAPSWLLECTAETIYCDVPKNSEVGVPVQ